jgi:hypothetical protein
LGHKIASKYVIAVVVMIIHEIVQFLPKCY